MAKTIDGLMRHLRNDNGVKIHNSKQKIQLTNQGYFHGYKGYRFFKTPSNRLPITEYEQINQTIIYDTALKSLFYDKVMFIETALKNITLDEIMKATNSNSIHDMYDKVIVSYVNSPSGATQKIKTNNQRKSLTLQNKIMSRILQEYKNENNKITHFYNHLYPEPPIWAIFEIIMMGDFGELLEALVYDMRDRISKRLGLNLSGDTNRELIYKYVYRIKGLRNAVAHNGVVYDARFENAKVSPAEEICLTSEFSLPYAKFNDIIDYVILIVYINKLLKVAKTEQKRFINSFITITETYINSIGTSISRLTINPNWKARLKIVLNKL